MFSNTFPVVTLAAFALLASTPATLAQDLSTLPPCASKCLPTALATGGKSCVQTDFACLCKNSDFVAAANKCYTSSCTVSELADAQKWAVGVCAAAGVQLATGGAAAAANGVANAANGVANAANGVANATNNTANSLAGNSNNNTAPVAGNPARNNSNSAAVALPVGAMGAFAITSALASSLFLI